MKFYFTLTLLTLLTVSHRLIAALTGKDFPYVVAITDKTRCCDKDFNNTKSGTLINSKYVLCSSYAPGDIFKKTLRVFLVKNGKVSEKSMEVEKVILHPTSDLMTKDLVNIALLKLKECVNDIKSAKLIQREKKIKKGTTVISIKLAMDSKGNVIVKPKKLKIAAKRECKSAYQGEHMFCVKGDYEKSYNGVGPTMYYSKDEKAWRQIGLSSFRLNPVTYFTRINDVIEWIKDSIDNTEVEKCKRKEKTLEETSTDSPFSEVDDDVEL